MINNYKLRLKRKDSSSTSTDTKSISIEINGIVITLDVNTWKWSLTRGDEKEGRGYKRFANLFTQANPYRVSYGQPGYKLASDLARVMHGKAYLPPLPKLDPNVLY